MKNLILTVLTVRLVLGAFLSVIGSEKQTKPNIIFFLADDMRTGVMGCEGNTVIKTPNLDHLAAEGVRFSNAFVTTSICCCSRASILTGRHIAQHGVKDFKTPLSEDALKLTYPMLLKDAGYQIGFIGKYGIGKNVDGVKDKFDYFYGTAAQPQYENIDKDGNYIHYTDIVDHRINEFFENTDTDKPFCLSVSFKAPHVQDGDPRQFIYNPRFEKNYANDEIAEVPSNTLEEWEKFPDFFKENNEARKRWLLRFSNKEQYEKSVKGYYRLITGLDEVVGNAIKKLEELGLNDNTIIIFFSDNGFYLGEHGLAGKWYAHEPSIRVPFIIYNPTDTRNVGKEISDCVLNIDIAPTILSYAGIDCPELMQGKSLLPLLSSDEQAQWRNSFYYDHSITQFKTIPVNQALRTERYKYIIYPEAEPVYEEVYDLKNDNEELDNLALKHEYKLLLDSLRSAFKAEQAKVILGSNSSN